MNRRQRRIYEARLRRGEIKKTYPLGIDCVDPKNGFKIGDMVKIPGWKIMPDGTKITDCKKGEETVFRLVYQGKQNRFKEFQKRKRKEKWIKFFQSIKEVIYGICKSIIPGK